MTSESGERADFDLTVVVPSRGRPELCGVAVAAVDAVREATGLRIDLVVVEQGEAPAYPIPEGFRGRWVFTERTGVSMARNLGLDLALAPFVMFVDDDAELRPGVADLLADLRTAGGDLVAGTMSSPDGETVRGGDRRAVIRSWNAYRYFVEPAAIWSVEALRAVGGFDERLGHGNRLGGEEGIEAVARLARRAGAAGGAIRFVPEPAVVHPVLGGASAAKARRYGTGTSGAIVLSLSRWVLTYAVASLVRRCGGIVMAAVRRDRPGLTHRAGWVVGWSAGPFVALPERRRPRRGPAPAFVRRVDTTR